MTTASASYRSLWTSLRTLEFQQAFIDVSGIRTRYVHAGSTDKAPLIMLHGTAGHWEAFASNLEAHAEHFDCYGMDTIGCGFSSKPDQPYEIKDYAAHVLAFADKMGLERFHLMGCSLGAWVSATIARDHPERVGKIVLLSAAGYFSSADNRERIKSQRTKAVDDPSWENVKAIFNKLLAKEESRIDDLVAHRQAIYSLPEMKQAMNNILVLQDPEIRQRNLVPEDDWRKITAEALVIGSLADADEYLNTARVVSGLMPNAKYVEMPEVGHWPQFENPETFNRISLDFLIDG